MAETVWLQRPGVDVPWGFRLHGGRDYQTPLSVQKVTSGSIAATGLSQGDVILRIGEAETSALTYSQAMDVIKNSGNLLQLSISKSGGQGAYSPQVDAASNMTTSGALHDLFQDMYRHTDPYEGAQSHTQAAPTPSYSYQPSHSSGGGSAYDGASNFDQYGRQQSHGSSGSTPYQYSNVGAGATPAPPAQAPPTYSDVQTNRDQVAYPYQPTHAPSTPSYPYQPPSAHNATNQSYQYPHSMSSSTSELSDVSSGFGTSDGRQGASPAMASPHAGGVAKPYTSGSSVDSSSGVGSYNCETPDHAGTTYAPQPVSRQDSFPLPPPPPTLEPATRLEQQLANMNVDAGYGRQSSYPYQNPEPRSPVHQPVTPAAPPPPPPPAQAPYYGGATKPTSPVAAPAPRAQHVMPDAVLNMAARGGPDKKPFTYAPDADIIKEQRDKVRRRAPGGGMPRYQQMLNLPQFDDPPKHRGHIPQTPPTPSTPPQYAPGPGEANVAHMQYNSPLQIYSEGNVSEAFTGQTDGVVTNVGGLKKDQGQDVTQSPVYRMIHGLDSDKPKRPVATQHSSEGHRGPRAPAQDDELCFSGVLDRSDIPSKSFHRLQSMTGGPDNLVDTTSIRHNVSGDGAPEETIGDYDQASIRYTGRNIPSKSFRMLQSMTGEETGSGSELTVPGPQRRIRRQRPQPEPQSPEQNPDDIVDISYVGGNIPSRSFKVLQHAMGTDSEPGIDRGDDYYDEEKGDAAAYDDMYYLGENIPSRSFQLLQSVVGNDPHAVATERRQRRRNRITSRQNSMKEEEMIAVQSDQQFDEQAYLAGQVAIKIAADDQPKPKRVGRSCSREVAPWQPDVDPETAENTARNEQFDEEAYLSGRISIMGNEPKCPPRPTVSEMMQRPPETTDDTDAPPQDNFDENAYLSGQISMLGGETKPLIPTEDKKPDQTPQWAKKRRAQLSRRKNSKQVKSDNELEEQYLGIQKKETPKEPEEEPKPAEPFDENAYLAGQVLFLGGNPAAPKREEVKPSGESVASWQKPVETEGNTEDAFDEDAYLRGKVPILRESVERELPPRDDKPKQFRERAPWEKPNEEEKTDPDLEFDENNYLSGRTPYVRKSEDRDVTSPVVNGGPAAPPRKVHYLRRSVSRDESELTGLSSGRSSSRSSSVDLSEEDDSNNAYNEMVYVGKSIPSKTFLRLKKSVAKRSRKPLDHIDHLKERMMEGVDIDAAMEKLNIDHHDPDEYLEKLKQTVQQNNNIKIEAIPNEVTDF